MNNSKVEFKRVKEETTCPFCKEELDDDDGTFFDKTSDTKPCDFCKKIITYSKNYKRDYGNPYCDYVWSDTYMKWEEVA